MIFQDQRPKTRKFQCQRVGTVLGTGLIICVKPGSIILIPATIDVLVGVENLLVRPGLIDANVVIIIEIAGHIKHKYEMAIAVVAFKRKHALFGIIDLLPVVVCGIILFHLQRFFCLIDEIEVADEAGNRIVLWERLEIPR